VRSPPSATDDPYLVNLIKRCALGDQSALRTIYEILGAWLLGIANRLVRDQSVAEEVVQDAFVQVWHHADRFDATIGSAQAWIASIVRYRALDRRTAETRHINPANLEIGQAEAKGILGGLPPDFSEDGATLQRCLGELKDGPYQSIVLAYVEGYSHAEIADRLGQPLGTVKSWIVRGLEMLKRCLER
jgi:RNA polymerase sigma-70 factor (ECF subfamily)